MNGRRLLVASVISVQNSHFVYPSCQNCFSKLLLDLKRYSCLKCGYSGDSKEANYRYRLSLEVADTQSVFEVTVFGSCLDVYFGVTAKDLHRYIEKLHQEVGEPDGEATPDMVFRAAESCFVGKKFVFGIKDYDKPESTSWQNDRQINRYPKALIACQMFMPNSGLIGNTVIHYLQKQQCSLFKLGQGGICPPDVFMAFDQPSSEVSSLHGSGDLGVVPSCSADGLSVLWPQSFRLTSSPVSSGTEADPIDLNPSKTACIRQKWEDDQVSLHSQLIYNFQDHNLTVTKRDLQDDKRSNLYSNQRSCIVTKSQPESAFFSGRENGRLLQSSLELEKNNLSSKNSIQDNYWLKKSCNHLPHQRLNASLCFPISSSIPLPSGEFENSQESPWLWDELPSSESLNEFIAKIESDNTIVLPTKVQVHFHNDGFDEFHKNLNQLSPKPDIFHVNLKTGQPGEKLQVLEGKVERGKEDVLPCHHLNLLPSYSSQESHQEAVSNSLSSKGKEKSGYPSHQHMLPLPSLSLVEVKSPYSEESCLKSEEGVDQDVNSYNCYSSSCSKSSSKCLDNSSLQIRNITPHLSGKDGDDPLMRKGKGSPYRLNKTTATTNIQEDNFASGTCKKSVAIGETVGELLFQVNECSFKRDGVSLLQKCSDGRELSYCASDDLFDSSREAEATVGKLNSAHMFLAEENPGTKQSIKCEFVPEYSLAVSPCEPNGSWNTSSCSMLITSDPKTNSPVAGLISGSEHSLSGSLDFVPNSQSTPVARPCLQVRLPQGKESILSEFPLNKLSWLTTKCKRFRSASGNRSVRRLVSRFLQCRRLSGAEDSPTQGLPESDGEEWIPPSEEKQVQPFGIHNVKVLRKRKNLVKNANCQSKEQSPLSESKVRCGIPRNSARLVRVELSPKSPTEIRFGKQLMWKDSTNCRQVMNGFFDVSSNLSPPPCSMANVPSWSPELFSGNSQLLGTEATFSKSSA